MSYRPSGAARRRRPRRVLTHRRPLDGDSAPLFAGGIPGKVGARGLPRRVQRPYSLGSLKSPPGVSSGPWPLAPPGDWSLLAPRPAPSPLVLTARAPAHGPRSRPRPPDSPDRRIPFLLMSLAPRGGCWCRSTPCGVGFRPGLHRSPRPCTLTVLPPISVSPPELRSFSVPVRASGFRPHPLRRCLARSALATAHDR